MGGVGEPGGDIVKPSGKAEPRFDLDYAYGRQAEIRIEELLSWIGSGNKKVEVKRKRILDLEFYVETHCDKGRRGEFAPSGINVTTAQVWAFVLGDTGMSVFVPTDLLQIMIEDPTSKDRSETDGSCPTKGKLVNMGAMLFRAKQRAQALRGVAAPSARSRTDEDIIALEREPVSPLDVDSIKWG